MELHDWIGNLSDVLIAGSYLVTSMLWLRVLAILGLSAEGLYFYFAGAGSLWVAICWALVFLAINTVQLWRLMQERLSVRLSDEERVLNQGTFAGLSPVAFQRLLRGGQWRDVPEGTVLTREAEPVSHLYAFAGGRAEVTVGGMPVAMISPGGIVGEMSFLEGAAASATVTATEPVRTFEIAHASLTRLLQSDDDLRAAFHRALGGDLVGKVAALRRQRAGS